VNYTPLLAAQRSGSTTAGPGHGAITAKPLAILEKLQTKSNTASPGFITVGENEGLLFFDSLWPFPHWLGNKRS